MVFKKLVDEMITHKSNNKKIHFKCDLKDINDEFI